MYNPRLNLEPKSKEDKNRLYQRLRNKIKRFSNSRTNIFFFKKEVKFYEIDNPYFKTARKYIVEISSYKTKIDESGNEIGFEAVLRTKSAWKPFKLVVDKDNFEAFMVKIWLFTKRTSKIRGSFFL